MFELPMKIYSTGRKVVDWQGVIVGFKLTIDTYIIRVLENKMVEKTAKTSGKKRKERRLTLQLNGFEETYECGTESFKKGSFLKNLIKKSITEIVKTIAKPSSYLPMKLEDVPLVNFIGDLTQQGLDMFYEEFKKAITFKEIKDVYRKYAKRLHPDTSRANQNSFEILVSAYEYNIARRRMMVDICRENGVDMEY